MAIRIVSLDFDGCLFNEQYFKDEPHHNKEDVITPNQTFLDRLKEENEDFDEVTIFVGSARQSFLDDQSNSLWNRTMSCFKAIKKITDYLGDKAKLDTFLLADIYDPRIQRPWFERQLSQSWPEGQTYQQAMDALEKPVSYVRPRFYFHQNPKLRHDSTLKHPVCYYDETKVLILYAQIHKAAAASANPNELIVFDFYDDIEDILLHLKTFFTNYPELIPANVTLRLHHYEGSESLKAEYPVTITGAGKHDKEYKKTVRTMFNICNRRNAEIQRSIEAAQYVTHELLIEYSPDKESTRFFAASAFPVLLAQLKEKAKEFNHMQDGSGKKAHRVINELLLKLSEDSTLNNLDSMSQREALDAAHQVQGYISEAHSELNEHNGVDRILFVLSRIFSFVFDHLTPERTSSAAGEYTFFLPEIDSMKILDDMSENLSKQTDLKA